MKSSPPHLAQDLGSHVEQGSQPVLALFREEKSQRKLKNGPLKPSPCMAALNPTKLEAWRMFNPTPQQKLHPAVRWRCQNPPEDLEGVWGCRGRQEELQVFPFSCPSPGRQAGLNTSIQDTTEKITKFALQYGELGETDKEKGKKELRERPLFLWKNKAGSCRAGLSPCHPLASSRRAHLHWLLGLYSRHSSHNPQCPSKMFAVMLSRAILLVSFALTPSSPRSSPWTAPCADGGQRPETSKLRKKNYFLHQRR